MTLGGDEWTCIVAQCRSDAAMLPLRSVSHQLDGLVLEELARRHTADLTRMLGAMKVHVARDAPRRWLLRYACMARTDRDPPVYVCSMCGGGTCELGGCTACAVLRRAERRRKNGEDVGCAIVTSYALSALLYIWYLWIQSACARYGCVMVD